MIKKECIRCRQNFEYHPTECYWNEKGSESVKLVDCKECGCIQPIKYEPMRNPNTDVRYYFFKHTNI